MKRDSNAQRTYRIEETIEQIISLPPGQSIIIPCPPGKLDSVRTLLNRRLNDTGIGGFIRLVSDRPNSALIAQDLRPSASSSPSFRPSTVQEHALMSHLNPPSSHLSPQANPCLPITPPRETITPFDLRVHYDKLVSPLFLGPAHLSPAKAIKGCFSLYTSPPYSYTEDEVAAMMLECNLEPSLLHEAEEEERRPSPYELIMSKPLPSWTPPSDEEVAEEMARLKQAKAQSPLLPDQQLEPSLDDILFGPDDEPEEEA